MEFQRSLRALGLGFLALFLVSCNMWPVTHRKEIFKVIPPAVRLSRFDQFNYWRVEGTFSVQCVGLPHARSLSVTRFSWKNFNRNNFTLRLESTYEDWDATVMVEYNDILVWRDFKYPFHIKHPEAYMQENMGWQFPIKSMGYWLRGIPAPAPFVAKYDQYGLITELSQQGWVIHFFSYTDLDGYDVPRAMIMSSQGVFIRVVMNNWDSLLLNRSVEPL